MAVANKNKNFRRNIDYIISSMSDITNGNLKIDSKYIRIAIDKCKYIRNWNAPILNSHKIGLLGANNIYGIRIQRVNENNISSIRMIFSSYKITKYEESISYHFVKRLFVDIKTIEKIRDELNPSEMWIIELLDKLVKCEEIINEDLDKESIDSFLEMKKVME